MTLDQHYARLKIRTFCQDFINKISDAFNDMPPIYVGYYMTIKREPDEVVETDDESTATYNVTTTDRTIFPELEPNILAVGIITNKWTLRGTGFTTEIYIHPELN